MKRFILNSVFGSVSSLSATVGNLLTSLIVARMLGVDGTGQVAFVIWVATTAVTLFSLGIPATLARYLPALAAGPDADDARRVTNRLFTAILVAMSIPFTALVGLALWSMSPARVAGAPLDWAAPYMTPTLCLLAADLCLVFALTEFVRGYYRGAQSFDRLAALTTISAICQTLCVGIGAAMFKVPGAIGAYLLGAAIIALAIWRIPPSLEPLPPAMRPRLKRYAAYRWASEVNAAFVWSRIEVIFLQVASGTSLVGLFTAGLTLVNLAVQGTQMLGWGLLPHFSEQFARNKIDGMRLGYEVTVRAMALLTFPACFGLAAILPELMPVLFGPHFAAAVPSATILVIGASIIGPGTVAVTVTWAMERSDIEFTSGLLGVAVAVGGGLVLIPTYGVVGAALSRVATQLAFVIVCNLYLVRGFAFRVPVADLARTLAAALLCACAARASLAFVWMGPGGIPASVLVGIGSYAVALRWLRVVPANDSAWLWSMASVFPVPIATASRLVLRFVSRVGSEATAGDGM